MGPVTTGGRIIHSNSSPSQRHWKEFPRFCQICKEEKEFTNLTSSISYLFDLDIEVVFRDSNTKNIFHICENCANLIMKVATEVGFKNYKWAKK